jgi:hypothetical protein
VTKSTCLAYGLLHSFTRRDLLASYRMTKAERRQAAHRASVNITTAQLHAAHVQHARWVLGATEQASIVTHLALLGSP